MRALYFYVSIFFSLGCCATAASSEKQLLLATTVFPPYYAKELPQGGPISEIVREAFHRVGYAVKITFYPWARALEMGKNGAVDGLSGVWHSSEREKWFLYSNPLPGNELVLLKRRDTAIGDYSTFEALRPYKIGIVRGYANPPEFDAAGLATEPVTKDLQNIKKLLFRRVDLILIDKSVAYYLIKTNFPDETKNVDYLRPPLKYMPMYLVISKRNARAQQIVDAFNVGLLQIQQAGELARITTKHGFMLD